MIFLFWRKVHLFNTVRKYPLSVSNNSLTCHFHFYARQSTKGNVCTRPGINTNVTRIIFIKEKNAFLFVLVDRYPCSYAHEFSPIGVTRSVWLSAIISTRCYYCNAKRIPSDSGDFVTVFRDFRFFYERSSVPTISLLYSRDTSELVCNTER